MKKWFLFFCCLLIESYYAYAMEDPKRDLSPKKFVKTSLASIAEEEEFSEKFRVTNPKEKKRSGRSSKTHSNEVGWLEVIESTQASHFNNKTPLVCADTGTDSENKRYSKSFDRTRSLSQTPLHRRLSRTASGSFINVGSHFLRQELSLLELLTTSPLDPEKRSYKSDEILNWMKNDNCSLVSIYENTRLMLGLLSFISLKFRNAALKEHDDLNTTLAKNCLAYIHKHEREFSLEEMRYNQHYYEEKARQYSELGKKAILKCQSIENKFTILILDQTAQRLFMQSRYFFQQAQRYGCENIGHQITHLDICIQESEKAIQQLSNYDAYISAIERAKQIENQKNNVSVEVLKIAQKIDPNYRSKIKKTQRLSELIQSYQPVSSRFKSIIKKSEKMRSGSYVHPRIKEELVNFTQNIELTKAKKSSRASASEVTEEYKRFELINDYLLKIEDMQNNYYLMANYFLDAHHINPDLKLLYIVQGIIDKIKILEEDKNIFADEKNAAFSQDAKMVIQEYVTGIQFRLDQQRLYTIQAIKDILEIEKGYETSLQKIPIITKVVENKNDQNSLFFKNVLAILLPTDDLSYKVDIAFTSSECLNQLEPIDDKTQHVFDLLDCQNLSGRKLVITRFKLKHYLLDEWQIQRKLENRQEPELEVQKLLSFYKDSLAQEEEYYKKLYWFNKGHLFEFGAAHFYTKSAQEKDNFQKLLYLNQSRKLCIKSKHAFVKALNNGNAYAEQLCEKTILLQKEIRREKEKIVDEKLIHSIKDEYKTNERMANVYFEKARKHKQFLLTYEQQLTEDNRDFILKEFNMMMNRASTKRRFKKLIKKKTDHATMKKELQKKLTLKKERKNSALSNSQSFYINAAQAYNKAFNNDPCKRYLKRAVSSLDKISMLQQQISPDFITHSQTIVARNIRKHKEILENLNKEWKRIKADFQPVLIL